ncbi:cation transporter [Pradoshia sp. D12]|uniref:cation diffusion facilitator family transporter n=1 Tax=Bacillaceae TaxID=186817 RepID=UPI00080AEF8F|nr:MULTISPECIES: cation diffusion facilitator family transporter [Bacillaceae]OCA86270.1 cation diffusion facilitator family transporter [Bacillus sp. FJAT-27986]QFK72068.1 cation transporter [Pradoshia sp. D12]TPF71440.1 cation transporter [Bacillus sp. D12]
MGELFQLLKKGNTSAITAAIVNLVISIIKGAAYMFTGNVALFAETLHSLGDSANQFFVFIGSALSKKAPTERFPNGFGRLVNLVLLGAVLIVGIMSYETIKEGYMHILHPSESSYFWVSIGVLAISVILEVFVLVKAMKEIMHEVGVEAKGLSFLYKSFTYFGKAKPATRLVFLEDLVATSGGVLAIIAIVISHLTNLHAAEGIASILIGMMMLFVVGKVFFDNAAGALGEADELMEQYIGDLVLLDKDIKDVQKVVVIKEGEDFHVEVCVEIDLSLTVADMDDIKDRLKKQILAEKGVVDVMIEFDEDDGLVNWNQAEKLPAE